MITFFFFIRCKECRYIFISCLGCSRSGVLSGSGTVGEGHNHKEVPLWFWVLFPAGTSLKEIVSWWSSRQQLGWGVGGQCTLAHVGCVSMKDAHSGECCKHHLTYSVLWAHPASGGSLRTDSDREFWRLLLGADWYSAGINTVQGLIQCRDW